MRWLPERVTDRDDNGVALVALYRFEVLDEIPLMLALIGSVSRIPEPELGAARTVYLTGYPDSKYWVDFDDFFFLPNGSVGRLLRGPLRSNGLGSGFGVL